jgi:hypothetical protein
MIARGERPGRHVRGRSRALRSPSVSRALFELRSALEDKFGWDESQTPAWRRVASLRDRLPPTCSYAPRGPDFASVPMTSVY